MTCYDIQNPYNIQSSLFLNTRVCIPIHNRKINGCSTCILINWHCITWHLLCSSTLPLCPINKNYLHNHRRVYSMIPTIHWTYCKPKMIKGSICLNVNMRKGTWCLNITTHLHCVWKLKWGALPPPFLWLHTCLNIRTTITIIPAVTWRDWGKPWIL